MTESTKVKFQVPVGIWGSTEVEVEYPWHRDLDSIILPLLETAHEAQAERQRKYRAESQAIQKGISRKKSVIKSHSDTVEPPLPVRSRGGSLASKKTEPEAPPKSARPDEDIKLFLKGFENATSIDIKRGDVLQTALTAYAKQAGKDVERLELFHRGKHAQRDITPDADSRTVQNCRSTSSRSNLESSVETDSIIDVGIARPRSDSSTADPRPRDSSSSSCYTAKALRVMGVAAASPQRPASFESAGDEHRRRRSKHQGPTQSLAKIEQFFGENCDASTRAKIQSLAQKDGSRPETLTRAKSMVMTWAKLQHFFGEDVGQAGSDGRDIPRPTSDAGESTARLAAGVEREWRPSTTVQYPFDKNALKGMGRKMSGTVAHGHHDHGEDGA